MLSKQMLAFLRRKPNHFRQTFGHGRAIADLMNANGPVPTDQLQHNPPLHSELPATNNRRSISAHLLDLLDSLIVSVLGIFDHKTGTSPSSFATGSASQQDNSLNRIRADVTLLPADLRGNGHLAKASGFQTLCSTRRPR